MEKEILNNFINDILDSKISSNNKIIIINIALKNLSEEQIKELKAGILKDFDKKTSKYEQLKKAQKKYYEKNREKIIKKQKEYYKIKSNNIDDE